MRKCRMCEGTKFKQVIDFGQNPLVNSLIEKKDLHETESTFSLIVEQCQECFLVQIVEPIDSHEIYKDVDYLFFSGDMPNLKEYFQEYESELRKRFLDAGDFVVEIGSNDGIMLSLFPSWISTLGVDPASNVVVRALKRGVLTVSDFFSERIAKSIRREFGETTLIYGNNCIAHLSDLHDLMAGVRELLKQGGIFAVECNYWGGMVRKKNYSLIYHDHFSYFTMKNWVDFAPNFGMHVFDAYVTPAQGGSLRVFMRRGDSMGMEKRGQELLDEEIDTKLNSYKTAKRYNEDVRAEALKLGNLIKKLKDENKTIAGYGAAAKGFSILKLAEIDEHQIDYFVDDSPAKQGKYTPISHIPIISREEADKQLPDYFFITAPNYSDVIIEKEKVFKKQGGKFILASGEIV